jgi:hypothetical protein
VARVAITLVVTAVAAPQVAVVLEAAQVDLAVVTALAAVVALALAVQVAHAKPRNLHGPA